MSQARPWWRRPLPLALVAVGCVFLFLIWRSRGPSELDRWVAERRQQGERFTLADHELDHPAPFRSPAAETVDKLQGTLWRLLHPSGPSEGYVTETAPGRWIIRWQQPQMESYRGFRARWEMMEGLLDKAEPTLAEVRAAVSTIVVDPGGDSTQARSPINFVAMREAAQFLTDATVIELHRQRPAMAMTNLVSLIRLARQHEQAGLLVTQVVRVSIAELAVEATWQALQYETWSEAGLAMLQQELVELDLLAGVVRGFEIERATTLHWLQAMREGRTPGAPGAPAPGVSLADVPDRLRLGVWRSLWSDRDELFYLQTFQVAIDGLRRLDEGGAWIPLQADLSAAWASRSQVMASRRFQLTHIFSMIALPNLDRAIDRIVETEALRRLCLIAVSLARYQKHHRQWPGRLSDLKPGFLDRPPLDPFTAEPFRYLRVEAGWPELYSIGNDGQDDGGGENDLVWPRPHRAEGVAE